MRCLLPPTVAVDSDRGITLFYCSCTTQERVPTKWPSLQSATCDCADARRNPSHSRNCTGRGTRVRLCPLWASTTAVLKELITGRGEEERVFLGRSGQAMTRFGVHDIVTRYARVTIGSRSGLQRKQVGPHMIRHTTATHLLRAGVDINTIRAWLGHVSIDTTNIYAESDLQMKAKALGMCESILSRRKRWRDNPDLLQFLAQL